MGLLQRNGSMSLAVDAIYENGVLRLLDRLDLPEHQQVRVTVEPVSSGAPEPPRAETSPPEWLDVENDVAFRMPFRWEPVRAHALDAGTIPPTAILPEDRPDA